MHVRGLKKKIIRIIRTIVLDTTEKKVSANIDDRVGTKPQVHFFALRPKDKIARAFVDNASSLTLIPVIPSRNEWVRHGFHKTFHPHFFALTMVRTL